jgi:hypothetical protein
VRIAKLYLMVLAMAVAATAASPVAPLTFVYSPPESPSARQPTPAPQFTASVTTDKDAYVPGEPVAIVFAVTNLGPGVTLIRFPTSCQAAFLILAADEPVVYDLRSHVGCYHAFTDLTFGPGETRTFTFAWDQTTDSGLPVPASRSYRIRGFLQSWEPVPGTTAEATIYVTRVQAEPNLAFAARMDADVYDPGDSANVTVVLTNIGQDTVVMHFTMPCYVQFVVIDEESLALFNSSRWVVCIMVLHDEILSPGESRSWTFLWDLTTDGGSPLAPGRYQVVPSFHWGSASYYQPYVSRTDAASFVIAGFEV